MADLNREEEIKRTVEALIFASDIPLKSEKILEILQDASVNIPELISELNEELLQEGHPFFIREIAGGYQFMTREVFAPWIKRLYARSGRLKLSRAGLETLAIIAYKQPITKAEVESIRGVNSDGILRSLLEKDLIHIEGRMEAPGRPLLYATTEKFLNHFGLNSLDELPRLREIEELFEDRQPEEGNGIPGKAE